MKLAVTLGLLMVAAVSPALASSPKTALPGFNGQILMSRGDKIEWNEAFGHPLPHRLRFEREQDNRNSPTKRFSFDTRASWRLASVTKQIVATLVLQQVAEGRIDLEAPVGRYLPDFRSPNANKISVRQLLRHQSGLPNPDDTPKAANGVPEFYRPATKMDINPLSGWCAGTPKGEPGGRWEYNNCDYLVAGALLEKVTGKPWFTLVSEKIAKPLRMKSLRMGVGGRFSYDAYADDRKEPPYAISAFGSAGSLYGTLEDLWRFDRALMTGKLLPAAQRAELWDGKPDLGFIALGQWVFEAGLKGCEKPVRIVERRGAIGGVQIRNFILPDADIVLIAATNRADFDFGEIWQGSGFSHDLLAEAACSR